MLTPTPQMGGCLPIGRWKCQRWMGVGVLGGRKAQNLDVIESPVPTESRNSQALETDGKSF